MKQYQRSYDFLKSIGFNVSYRDVENWYEIYGTLVVPQQEKTDGTLFCEALKKRQGRFILFPRLSKSSVSRPALILSRNASLDVKDFMSTFNILTYQLMNELDKIGNEFFLPWRDGTVEVIYLPFYLSTLDDTMFKRVMAEISRVISRERERRGQLVIVDDFINPVSLTTSTETKWISERRWFLDYPDMRPLYLRSLSNIFFYLQFSIKSLSVNPDGSRTLILQVI